MRSYSQYCSVAKALDVLGERWAILVIRELLLGPKRYSDLLAGLPGIGTNVLATRLRELEGAGLVAKRQLPAPTAVTVYELTERGEQTGPVLAALARFGAPLIQRPPRPDEDVQPARLVLHLSATLDASGLPDGVELELILDGVPYALAPDGDRLKASAGSATHSLSTIAAPFTALSRLATGRSDPARFLRHNRVSVDGDQAVARAFLDAIADAARRVGVPAR